MEYGSVLLAHTIAERLGIPEDLESSFGRDGRRILAFAVMRVVRRTVRNTSPVVLGDSCICGIVGVSREEMAEETSDGLMRRLGIDEVHAYFRSRLTRSDGPVVVWSTPVHMSIPGRIPGNLTDSVPFPAGECAYAAMAASAGCGPASFALTYRGCLDPGVVSWQSSLLSGLGKRVIFTTDGAINPPPSVMVPMVRDRTEFVIPYSAGSETYRAFERLFDGLEDEEDNGPCWGRSMKVREVGASLVNGEGGWSVVPSGRDVGDSHLRAYLTYKDNADPPDLRALKDHLRMFKEDHDGLRPEDPEEVMALAGRLAEFLSYEVTGDGRLRIIIRRGKIRRMERESRRSVLVTSTLTKSESLQVYRTKVMLREATESLESGSQWRFWRSTEGVGPQKCMMIDLVALQIYHEAQRVLRGSRSGMTVEEAFDLAGTYRLIVTDGCVQAGHRDRKVSSVFRLFGVREDDPADVLGPDGACLPSADGQ